MSSMLKRPPALNVVMVPLQGPSNRQTYGAVDSAKSYGSPLAGRQRGALDLRPGARQFQTAWLDVLQVNPAHEQPRLEFTSGAQPLIRWGVRHFTRTFMTASPRMQGRWAYVGFIQRHYSERPRLTGVPMRLGTTYAYPRWQTGPRTIQLGPAGG